MRPAPPNRYRGRFAPSPTGELHLGSLMAALGSWLLARRAGGEWLVRIEDLDPPREVPGASDLQLAALRSFGLQPDGEVVRQGRRGALYQDALDRLLASGAAFRCHCSRSDLADTGGIHRSCVGSGTRPVPAVRLRVPDRCEVGFVDALRGRQVQRVDREVGDFVLRRADGLWAYQLAVVVDDADQAVTDVVRGADLLDSTPRQILLQRALALPTPNYAHLPLVCTPDGRKLSKSGDAVPVDPADPLPALRAAWATLGQPGEAIASCTDTTTLLQTALRHFDPDRIPAPESASIPATVPTSPRCTTAL
ncbi:tRNA glutamyl-Q(34) synthetase GluQRS [Lysobacter sp. A3-1-A15]|uniref:tRNA glutamyl-Q(34) synthetase GluQRS n=1 Tax=Novilysobacter viscosus TaxID=3098602 RepID=UPI002EDA45BE